MQTKDYYQFKMPLHGRQINQDAITHVVNFVKNGNALSSNKPEDGKRRRLAFIAEQLKDNPIIVNEGLEVIEGKHRLEIARQLDLPVSYVIKGDE